MRKHSRTIPLIIMVVCLLGLTVGFAAFSKTLTVETGASVTPSEEDFSVEFSTSENSVTYGKIAPVVASSGASGPEIEIQEGSNTISGIAAYFTNDASQEVAYSFFIHNTGKYKAYLNEIKYMEIAGESVTKKCVPVESISNPSVDDACEGIEVLVQYRTPHTPEGVMTYGSMSNSDLDAFELGGQGSLALEPGESAQVHVGIHYNLNSKLNENFSIKFGNISFLFETVD